MLHLEQLSLNTDEGCTLLILKSLLKKGSGFRNMLEEKQAPIVPGSSPLHGRTKQIMAETYSSQCPSSYGHSERKCINGLSYDRFTLPIVLERKLFARHYLVLVL